MQENAKLNCTQKKELKAPVTALAPLDGYICCGVGPKVRKITPQKRCFYDDLTVCAGECVLLNARGRPDEYCFLRCANVRRIDECNQDLHTMRRRVRNFITQVNTVIVSARRYKSIFFLRWRNHGHQLTLLGKDYVHNHVYATVCIFLLYVTAFLLGLHCYRNS
jgi:hypothetical protein